MDFIFDSVAWVLNLCYDLMFENYVLALLMFALFVKVILLPLGIKQHSNSLKQARLRPLEAAVVKKYKGRNDRQSQTKRQQEIQAIQQKGGYSQLAGCLPLLIQLPVVIIIYNVIRKPLSYIVGFSDKIVKALGEVVINGKAIGSGDQIKLLGAMRSNPEAYLGVDKVGAATAGELLDKLPDFTFFGVNLAETPSFSLNWLVLVPIITFVTTFFTAKLTKKLSYQSPVNNPLNNDGDAKVSSIIMDLLMPVLSTWISVTVPAVIGIYWMYQNLFSVLQQFIMVKIRPYPKFTEEDYKEAERTVLGKKKKNKRGLNFGKNPDAPRVPSLHHIDDEEYNKRVVQPKNETPIPKEGKNLKRGNIKD